MAFYISPTKRLITGMVLAGTLFSSAMPTNVDQHNAQISAQLNIILNDKACKQIAKFIKETQAALEGSLLKEFNSELAERISSNMINTLITFCSFGDLRKLRNIKVPVVKLLIAFCSASEEFIKEAGKQYENAVPETKTFVEKMQTAMQNFKSSLWTSVGQVPRVLTATNNEKAGVLLNLVIPECASILASMPLITINNLPLTMGEVNKHLLPHTNKFSTYVQTSIAKTLSEQELTLLIDFIQSSTFVNVKNNKERLAASIMMSISPDVLQQVRTAIQNGYKNLSGPVAELLAKAKAVKAAQSKK